MTRRPSILSQVLSQGAEALAERWQVPQDNRPAFRQTFDSVMREAFGLYAGDRLTSRVRLYVAERSGDERQEQRRRIVEALQRQEEPAAIAQREGVTVRWVRVLRAKHLPARNG